MSNASPSKPPVIINHHGQMIDIVLNRPKVLNSLSLEMIRLIQPVLDAAAASNDVRFVLLRGAGEKGFCAGGDLKANATAVKEGAFHRADRFFEEEYALDLCIHRFPKPVIVLADGITMGGGLGLSAGADVVLATERTRMAMPECRIGFYPDVGATRWMFVKCKKGYPEFLGLTGYEMIGAECVRLGFASHLVPSHPLSSIVQLLREHDDAIPTDKSLALTRLQSLLDPFVLDDISENPAMDQWVAHYFAGKKSVAEILDDLSHCSIQTERCHEVFQAISERSPTALVLTLKLLRLNENRSLTEAFESEKKAAHYMLKHPDYFEGVRARILDKDDCPQWQPDTLEAVGELDIDI